MDAERQRWPHADAFDAAHDIQCALFGTVERILMVGSLRRNRETVGDVELLYIPKIEPDPGDLFGGATRNLADERLDELLRNGVLCKRPNAKGAFAWGEKNKLAIHAGRGIPLDLFATTPENWYVSLVIRTGGKETNLALTTGANRLGLTLMAYGCGVKSLGTGEVTPCNSEEEVFRACGVPYRQPWERK